MSNETIEVRVRLTEDTLTYYKAISHVSGVKLNKVIAVVLAMRSLDYANGYLGTEMVIEEGEEK
jgi:hypothetical protein